MWDGRDGKSGHMFVVTIDNVEFRVWKAAPYTEKQKEKVLFAATQRGYTPVAYTVVPCRFAPTHSSFCTYVAYHDWLSFASNLHAEWTYQMLPYMDELRKPTESKLGDWGKEVVA